MAFQDATSGGAEGFQQPWMAPKERGGGTEEVPLEIRAATSRQTLTGAAWGRGMSTTPPAQGGGPVIGGGMGSGSSWGTSGASQHRGFYGGPGIRTGGYA